MASSPLPSARNLGALLLAVAVVAPAWGAEGDVLRHFVPDRREQQTQIEAVLASVPNVRSAREHHEMLSSRPHAAGTPGDLATSESLAEVYSRLGFEVERQELYLFLPRPVAAEVEILAPERETLAVMEPPLLGDPYTGHADLDVGWLAYGADGEVTAEVVYANYGSREDFETLESEGVKVAGKIAVMRYGRLFRGFKVANAEAAGAVGAILYSDPADSGWGRGLPYPEGGWYSQHSIERGTVLTLPYPGDPLTPGSPPSATPGDAIPNRWRSRRSRLSRSDGGPPPASCPGWRERRSAMTIGKGAFPSAIAWREGRSSPYASPSSRSASCGGSRT